MLNLYRSLKKHLKRHLPAPATEQLKKWLHYLRTTVFKSGLYILQKPGAHWLPLQNLLQKKLHWRVLPITWLDQHPTQQPLTSSLQSLISPPGGASSSPTLTQAPAINLYQFSKTSIQDSATNFKQDTQVIIERIPELPIHQANYQTGNLLRHNQKNALVKCPPAQETIHTGIYLGGNGAYNYYHWLLEILPKLGYLDQLPHLENIPLLLPQSVKTISSFQDALQLYQTQTKRPLYYLTPHKTYRVNTLYVLNSPNLIAFNLRTPKPAPNQLYLRPDTLWDIRSRALNMLKKEPLTNAEKAKLPRRFFVARKPGSARAYNQDEIIQQLKPLGIKPLYLEDLNFRQQIALFFQAEIIIGPSGAAWTNLVFVNPKAILVSWLPEHLQNFSGFSSLAETMGTHIHFIWSHSKNDSLLHGRYHLNTQKLERLLHSLIDAPECSTTPDKKS